MTLHEMHQSTHYSQSIVYIPLAEEDLTFSIEHLHRQERYYFLFKSKRDYTDAIKEALSEESDHKWHTCESVCLEERKDHLFIKVNLN